MRLRFNIGTVEIDGGLCLGPMAGVTDLPFRTLCLEKGCSLVCTEMVSAKAILYKNKNTFSLMKTMPEERPLALQLFGSDPKILAQISAEVEDGDWDFIDLNMGCPMPKIVNNGEGSAILKHPDLAYRILHAMVTAVKKPVTVKIRIGFSEHEINAVEIARACEAAGVAAIAVHGRTREQYYHGRADWDSIRRVKDAVRIPVIGNGDVVDGRSAKAILEHTGCDGIMIARAAQGDPWIFERILRYLESGEEMERPGADEVTAMMIRHLHLQVEQEGEYLGIRQMRKHIAWYTHGMKGSSCLREKVNRIENLQELEDELRVFAEALSINV